MGVTQRTIQRIAKEPPIEEANDSEARHRRAVGRPTVPDGVRSRLKNLIVADPQAPPLEILISEEIAHRAQITRSVCTARFPFLRTIEEFDFTLQNSVLLQMLGTLLRPELVSEGRGALISGAPGRGKTHLAVAIAYRAIQNGFESRFTTADELIGELSVAARRGQLEEALEPYVHPHVLVTSSAIRATLPTLLTCSSASSASGT